MASYNGGMGDAAWLRRFKEDEFVLLNGHWAGRPAGRAEAATLFLRDGVRRLAPVAFDAVFEPDYYREVHPEYAPHSDTEVYRRWLFDDLEHGWPGSAREHLRGLGLRTDVYPESFDWRAYAARRPAAGPNRWSAMQHLLEGGYGWADDGALDASGPTLHALMGDHHRGRDDPLAVRAFEAARRAGDRGYPVTHHLADALYRLERWRDALVLFREAARHPQAEVWTFVNGARAALRLGLFEQAAELLERGRDRVAGDMTWRLAVREVVESEFAAAERRARDLYAISRRGDADALLTAAVEKALDRWSGLDPVGLPMPAGDEGRVVMLANTDLRQCTHYRVEQKQQLFAVLGRPLQVFDARTEIDAFTAALPGAEAAIFYRTPAFPATARAMDTARRLRVPTFYDIDDLIFDPAAYPEPLETYDASVSRAFYEELQFGVPLFRAAMALCDFGVASTPSLARRMEPVVRTGVVAVLPNGLDDRNSGMLDARPSRVRRDQGVVLFYGSGTKAHNSDFVDLAGPGLLDVLRRRADVRLVIVGYLSLGPAFEAYRDRIVRIDWVPDIASYWSLLAEADVNLAVLAPYPTTHAKSEIKWLEAAVMAIPSVVSGTERYREVVEDGVDALIADTPEQWSQALDRLVSDAALRRRIGEAARAKAAARYTLEANAGALRDALALTAEYARPAPPGPARKPRVLLLNIFFPPQTIGGSTRVVRDNLDAWLDGPGAERFDFAVAASDNGWPEPNQVRVEDYRGVPVFRFSTPLEPNMEWRAFNPEVGAAFGRVLDAWRPDLVHFHCVQRMTASVIEAARARGLPYVVTLHDAWYVSDWHFLVDDRGRVRQPCEPLPLDPPAPASVGEALDRRRRLRPLLEGAAAILGVSRTFTDLHRACGFDAAALPNGVPPMASAERRPSPSGRVRLCHVGSQTPHKGYTLVEAALRRGRFRHLELTVVDHSRYGGEAVEAVWGATPVRFVGKTPQERMHDFYAGQDVLLAPSIWPESFGLVAREALACGLRVVAGNVGAMGEDVIPGVNGWIVDVANVDGLAEVLARIDADPRAHLIPPPPTPLRTAAEQAEDLLALYGRLLTGRPLASPADGG